MREVVESCSKKSLNLISGQITQSLYVVMNVIGSVHGFVRRYRQLLGRLVYILLAFLAAHLSHRCTEGTLRINQMMHFTCLKCVDDNVS